MIDDVRKIPMFHGNRPAPWVEEMLNVWDQLDYLSDADEDQVILTIKGTTFGWELCFEQYSLIINLKDFIENTKAANYLKII